jgi:hypothetical protein
LIYTTRPHSNIEEDIISNRREGQRKQRDERQRRATGRKGER